MRNEIKLTNLLFALLFSPLPVLAVSFLLQWVLMSKDYAIASFPLFFYISYLILFFVGLPLFSVLNCFSLFTFKVVSVLAFFLSLVIAWLALFSFNKGLDALPQLFVFCFLFVFPTSMVFLYIYKLGRAGH